MVIERKETIDIFMVNLGVFLLFVLLSGAILAYIFGKIFSRLERVEQRAYSTNDWLNTVSSSMQSSIYILNGEHDELELRLDEIERKMEVVTDERTSPYYDN